MPHIWERGLLNVLNAEATAQSLFFTFADVGSKELGNLNFKGRLFSVDTIINSYTLFILAYWKKIAGLLFFLVNSTLK